VPNPVVHFEITGADGPALQSFYRDLFDWKIDANNEWQYGMVETGGEGGINGGISGDQDGSARVSVYAEVDDLQAYLDKAERLGARVVMPVTDMGDFAIALFTDPAGNVTGLVKNSGNQAGGN
jgi:predicted enzyme related to lactoylglutathione lyase